MRSKVNNEREKQQERLKSIDKVKEKIELSGNKDKMEMYDLVLH